MPATTRLMHNSLQHLTGCLLSAVRDLHRLDEVARESTRQQARTTSMFTDHAHLQKNVEDRVAS